MRGERKRTWREEDDGRLGEETLRNILSKSLPRIVFCFVFDNLWFSLSLSLFLSLSSLFGVNWIFSFNRPSGAYFFVVISILFYYFSNSLLSFKLLLL